MESNELRGLIRANIRKMRSEEKWKSKLEAPTFHGVRVYRDRARGSCRKGLYRPTVQPLLCSVRCFLRVFLLLISYSSRVTSAEISEMCTRHRTTLHGNHVNRVASCLFPALVFPVLLLLLSCATHAPGDVRDNQSQHRLMGKTKQEVLTCAGIPIKENAHHDRVELIYYKEASLLEESFPGSKGSVPKSHHGCRANVQFKGDRVVGVRYQSVPNSYHDEDHCDEIFESCTMLQSQP